MRVGATLWRSDILLLEEAAEASCGRCASGLPLYDQAMHIVQPGVKVFCEASRINGFMASRMNVSLTPDMEEEAILNHSRKEGEDAHVLRR